jgi:hypothetical protein
MGPGMFDDMWKSLLFLIVLLMLAAAGCGAGCQYLYNKYDVHVTVEKMK